MLDKWEKLKEYIQKRIKMNTQMSFWDQVEEDNIIIVQMINLEEK